MRLQLRRVLRHSVLALAFVPALFVASPAYAIDAFMAIATIPGDSNVRGHEREIVRILIDGNGGRGNAGDRHGVATGMIYDPR